MTPLNVILTMLLVRITVPREKGTTGPGQSLFSLSPSRERSERLYCDLSRLFQAYSVSLIGMLNEVHDRIWSSLAKVAYRH
ncbi:hypothetical protein [Mesotoga prima]|uniref:hypothetical protein n=1 Tax=Mesotoga prima TaxID=1184387 RepID=UPI000C17E76B|nr:hypothetical protein V513_08185 [Mesotoga sp. H07.pep.5.3]